MYDTCANLCTPANLDTPGGFKRKNLPKTDPECEPLYNLPTPSPVQGPKSCTGCAAGSPAPSGVCKSPSPANVCWDLQWPGTNIEQCPAGTSLC